MDAQLVIGELARRTGYSPGMIRYFEKLGAITPSTRTAAGYRLFGPQHIKELQFIREMQDLGFYVPQIKALREVKSSEAPISEKRKAIKQVFEGHTKYVQDKASYFATLQDRLRVAAPTFVDRVMQGDR